MSTKNQNIEQIDDKFKEQVDSYKNKIVTLKDFVTAVRKMPGMYCAGKGNKGFLSLIREIYQNSIDQIINPDIPANHVDLYYNEITNEVMVSDNGLGFPFDDMVRIATAHHTSKNYTKQKGEYSSGLHGSGLKVVVALSTECIIESYHYSGKAKRLELSEGYVVKEPYDIPNKECRQGSVVKFIPSTEVLGELTLEWQSVYKLVKRILSLTPIGSEVNFKAIDINGVEHNEFIVNKDGFITELINNVKYPMCKPIIISEDTGEMRLDIAFTYDTGGDRGPDVDEKITAFCNMCPTIDGPHIKGAIDGICRWFLLYMNNIYLNGQKSKNKLKIINQDIKSGLNVMISAFCLEPIFVGQAKEVLSNVEMEPFCKDVIMRGLDNWSKSNPSDLQKLAKFFKDIAEVRMKAEGEKVKIVKKYQANALTGLPSNFARPTKRNVEFVIVEGDSAGGSAKDGRNNEIQGVFKIRGKIKSAFQCSYKEFMSNTEVQGIIHVILGGKEYTRKFDPYKDVEWEKIIFMADADVDGAHINALLLRFFVLYMPQLIEAGKVYRAVPPLYSIKAGGKTHYFTDQIDFVRYVQKFFSQAASLSYIDSKQALSNKDITVLLMRNEEYVYEIERISKTYAVDPKLLEMALFQYYNKTAFPALRKELKKEFRFMDVNKENNTIIYEGIIGKSNILFMNDRLVNDCKRVLNIIKHNTSLFYNMNGEVSSIYDIMKKFENSIPNSIQRYKGLGEMNADQIADSTLLPTSDRTLIRYTLEDAKEELEAIREYESDLSKLFPLVGNVKRADLLD